MCSLASWCMPWKWECPLQDAYAAKELALKQKHEAEVKALQEQLQNASKRPASRKGRAGKAGCPGKDNLLEKADHLQDENATLKEQLQAAQQVTEQLQQQLSQAAQSAQDASDLSHQLEALRKSAEDDNQRFQEELLAVADKERAHAEELRAQQQQQHGQVLEECEQLLSPAECSGPADGGGCSEAAHEGGGAAPQRRAGRCLAGRPEEAAGGRGRGPEQGPGPVEAPMRGAAAVRAVRPRRAGRQLRSSCRRARSASPLRMQRSRQRLWRARRRQQDAEALLARQARRS